MAGFGFVIAVVLAYFLGNINSATIISSTVFREEIRKKGSGSAGATNVFRNFGAGWGFLTMLLDAVKGYIAYFVGYAIGYWLAGELNANWYAAVAGIAAVLGHNWPALHGFKGGKGIATTFGVMLACKPVVGLIAFLLAALAVVVTNYMSIGSLLAAAFAEVCCLVMGPAPARVMMTVLTLLIIWQHRENIKRLMAGTENTMMRRSLMDVFRGKGKQKHDNPRDLK